MTTTTVRPPFRFTQDGHAFCGTPKWNIYNTINGEHLGFTAHATSKRQGTIWMAALPDGTRVGYGFRNRDEAATALLEEAANAQA